MTDKKLKPHVPAKRTSPILKKAGEPGGPHTPGAKKKRKKIKDGSAEGHKLTGVNQ